MSSSHFLFLVPALLILCIIGMAPLFSGVYNSFFHDYYGERSFAGFDNYKLLFRDRNFLYSLRITLVWATLTTLLSLFTGYIFAVRLVNSKWFSLPFYLVLLVPWGIPVYIAVPLWRALLHGNGGYSLFTLLFNLEINLISDPLAAFSAALFVNIWMIVPLTTFVFVGVMRKIPGAVIEAAKLDGACENDLSFNIYLPRISGTVLVMGVLNFIKSLKEFTVVFLMTAGGPPLKSGITTGRITGATSTLEILLYEIFSETNDFGIPASYSVIIMGLVVFLILLWIIIKQEKRNEKLIILSAAVAQLLFNGLGGVIFGALYLLSLAGFIIPGQRDSGKKGLWKRIFLLIFILHLVTVIIRLIMSGFIKTFDCGIIIALICLILLYKGGSGKRTRRVIAVPWFLKLIITGFSYFISGLTIVFTVLILYLLVWMSFSRANVCYMDALVPLYPTLKNYVEIFTREAVLKNFMNTFYISFITGMLIPVVALPCSAYLSQKKGAFPDFFLTLIKGVGIMTGIHSLVPLYALFNSLKLLNSYLPLVLIYLFHSVAFAVFTMKAYLEHLPLSFRENAVMEGMGPFAYLVKIIFPVSLPVITTAVMVSFLGAWNGFLAPLLFLNDDARYTISIKLFSFVGSLASGSPQWNLFAATSVVNLIFIVLVFLLLKKLVYFSPLKSYTSLD